MLRQTTSRRPPQVETVQPLRQDAAYASPWLWLQARSSSFAERLRSPPGHAEMAEWLARLPRRWPTVSDRDLSGLEPVGTRRIPPTCAVTTETAAKRGSVRSVNTDGIDHVRRSWRLS